MKLWLDDLRPPPDDGWHWVHNYDEAIETLCGGTVSFASLDHDLGDFTRKLEGDVLHYVGWKLGDPCPKCQGASSPKFNGGDPFFTCCNITVDEYQYHRMLKEKTGYDVVKWIVEHDTWPTDGIRIHSWNPAGAERMRQDIDRFGPYEARCIYEPDSRQWVMTDE